MIRVKTQVVTEDDCEILHQWELSLHGDANEEEVVRDVEAAMMNMISRWRGMELIYIYHSLPIE